MRKITEDGLFISFPEVQSLGLSITQYSYLALLYMNNPEAGVFSGVGSTEVEYLKDWGYLNDKYQLTDKTRELFDDPDSQYEEKFKELFLAFPNTIPDGHGGVRVLRSEGIDTKNYKECKRKYLSILKHKNVHTEVMRGLNNELLSRKNNTLKYMRNLETWLNKHIWEEYKDLKFENDERVSSI